MENLIERLNEAIDIEYDTKNTEINNLGTLPLKERILKGDSIGNLQATFLPIKLGAGEISFKQVTVTCEDNLSKFRDGSPVILKRDNYSFELNVLKDDGETLILLSGYSMYGVPSHLDGSNGWELTVAKVDIRHIVKKSTEILDNDQEKKSYISGIFSGSISPNILTKENDRAVNLVENTNLNPTQKLAFTKAYATKNYYLIQGPPGSGKTLLLAHLAVEFAKEGKKVLITASTHTAINNALQKASILSQYPHIIKVGKSHQKESLNDNGSTAKNIPNFKGSGYDNNSKGIIVGATCYSPQTRKLEFMDWDVIIVDEAGQLSVPLATAAMVKGKKYIFIGDHKQLPPIISEGQNDPIFSKSVFEVLFEHAPGVMLDTTYRMNKGINRFPSNQFYGGNLKSNFLNENWLLETDRPFRNHQNILDPNLPEVLYCHFHNSPNTRSIYEADLTADLVVELLFSGVSASEIACITPYRAQVRQLKKALVNKNIEAEDLEQIFVDTIEKIQGQERDVIIYSLATSDPIKAKQRAEFFFNSNRLNVALTRARKKRIVLASKKTFELEADDPKLEKLINVFKAFYNDAHKVYEESAGSGLF